MPTGYTADVADGKLTDFAAFAWRCARNFGALITMRDDPMNAPVPERLEPSSYHRERLVTAQQRLAELEAVTTEEAAVAAQADYAAAKRYYERQVDERAETQVRYEAMLAEVEAWKPPTVDHIGLKDFMRQQLEESIKWDCSTEYLDVPQEKSSEVWLAEEKVRALRDVAYADNAYADEVKRTDERNRWIEQLRSSLTR